MESHTNALAFCCNCEWAEIDGALRVVVCRGSEDERTTFRYDPVIRQTWANDDLGRRAHRQYDDHSEIVACTDLDSSDTSRKCNSYIRGNRLNAVKTDNQLGSVVTRFEYDPLGRRTTVTDERMQADGNAWTEQKRSVWQGLRMVQEIREQGVSSYVYLSDDDYTPLARLDAPIAAPSGRSAHGNASKPVRVYHFHTDLVGAPLEVTDELGELAWAGRYSAWGQVEMGEDVALVPRIDQPLRYPGQYADEETGLHYNTFRFYDPDVGRFISHDPIGLAGGENLYAYASNPKRWGNPHGLTKCMMSAADKRAMGPAPAHMDNAHMHHIIREMAPIKWSPAARQYILDAQALAKKYGIDVNTDPRNFVRAENGKGAHTIKAAKYVIDKLREADLRGKDAFFEALQKLGAGMEKNIFF